MTEDRQVIQDHRVWYQSKAYTWLHISA